MKVYRIEISSTHESAREGHDASAKDFGEAMKKAKRLKRSSHLYGQKRISSIVETVTALR